MDAPEVTNFRALPGNGLTAELDGQKLAGGSLAFAQSLAAIPQETQDRAARLAEQGKTPLFFCRSGKLLGVIAVADIIKPGQPAGRPGAAGWGIRVVMLTGDNERTAKAIGAQPV